MGDMGKTLLFWAVIALSFWGGCGFILDSVRALKTGVFNGRCHIKGRHSFFFEQVCRRQHTACFYFLVVAFIVKGVFFCAAAAYFATLYLLVWPY